MVPCTLRIIPLPLDANGASYDILCHFILDLFLHIVKQHEALILLTLGGLIKSLSS